MGNYSDFYYDREKLYEEVWAEPVQKVAQRYGVSDVAIAKTCRKMHIPVPGRGYWNKVQAGMKMKKLPLPKFEKCPQIKRMYLSPKQETPEEKEEERLVPEAWALEKQLLQKELQPSMQIKFNPKTRLTNQYVLNTKKKLEDSRKSISESYDFGRCDSYPDEAFAVNIGPDNIQRVLAILQTLCNALEKRGYSIGIKPRKPGDNNYPRYGYSQREVKPIYAIILDTYISFRISEVSHKAPITEKDRKASSYQYKYIPSGKLCFEIINDPYRSHARNKWHDGKVTKIEDLLNDIIINMIRVVTATRENEARLKIQEEQRKVEEAKRKEKERLERLNKSRIENVVKETERMVRLNQMKEYIELISAEGKQRLGESYPDSDFSKWVEWAQQFLKENGPDTWELPKYDLSTHPKFYWEAMGLL